MSKKKRVRSLAICVFRHADKILVAEGYDSLKNEYFYRPLGGAIEFGEPAAETICRELMEEIQVEVNPQSLRYLGTVENIFRFNGKKGHEILLIYDGALKKTALYEQPVLQGKEEDGQKFRAIWKSLHDFGEGKSILYPIGLLEMLTERPGNSVHE